ncbi:hypothetical protein G5714_003786 [Onychostoma macrolepis]|uniref:Uncharacterized protein n=1 Tax=Onychostoma macrolepis TaxID=369639 RepID=A0A7J6DAG2_9TELE|nr:hypothetical protein G5714_003786 [Onychostoma macrolepis]
MEAKPRRPIRDASGYSSGEIENADVSLEREMSGSRELRADWKESERDGGGGKSLSSAGTGAPVPWTGGAVLANIQPSPCSSTSSTHKQRQPLKTLLPYGCTNRSLPAFLVTRKSGPKADPDPWSAGPSTGSRLPFAQNAASSSCSTSQYPLVRRKYAPISPRKARREQEKPLRVLVLWTKWKIRRIGCSCWCRLQSYLRFETVTSNGLCLTMERKRLGAV